MREKFYRQEIVLRKTIVSSSILTTKIDLTLPASGELELLNIILKTDGTGLAAGTNIEIESNNANGLADIMVETVANLGANKTVNLADASVTAVETVLETGKKLTIKSTAAACTGAGVLTVYLVFKRMESGANILAA